MKAIYIITHLIMLTTALVVLYVVFRVKDEDKEPDTSVTGDGESTLFETIKAIGRGMKTQVLLLSGRLVRLNISNKLTRRID